MNARLDAAEGVDDDTRADPTRLVRDDLRVFAGYSSARREQDSTSIAADAIWLNANESPWPNPADDGHGLHRYPAPQPAALRARLAELYGVAPEQVLIGRGSDEAIDLLVRALCRAERDAVAIAPPVFGMYAVCARLQGARLIEVPLLDHADSWRTDVDALAEAALAGGAKLVFLCSPGNPTGEILARDQVRDLSRALSGRALVVVDEAYLEFADTASCAELIAECGNVAVLRTLSKLHALAGARVGCLLADARLIEILRRCQAPYPVPAPCAEIALRALSAEALTEAQRRAAILRAERQRVFDALARAAAVRCVYRSGGNFLLTRFHDAEAAYRALLTAGVVVRDMRAAPGLGDALRIGIGAPEENTTLLAVIAAIAAPLPTDAEPARSPVIAESRS